MNLVEKSVTDDEGFHNLGQAFTDLDKLIKDPCLETLFPSTSRDVDSEFLRKLKTLAMVDPESGLLRRILILRTRLGLNMSISEKERAELIDMGDTSKENYFFRMGKKNNTERRPIYPNEIHNNGRW